MCVCVCVCVCVYTHTVQFCIFFLFSPKVKLTKYVIPVEHGVLEKGIHFIKIIKERFMCLFLLSDLGAESVRVTFLCYYPSMFATTTKYFSNKKVQKQNHNLTTIITM